MACRSGTNFVIEALSSWIVCIGCVQGRSDTTVTDAGPNSSVIAPPVRLAVTGFGTTVFGASNVLTLSIFGAANVSPRSVSFF